MSEDKTQTLGNTDPAEESEVSKVPDKKMMLETLLLKVNEGFERMDSRFERVDSRLDKIDTRLNTVEKDIKEIKRNQRVFNNQLLAIEGRLADLEDERKAS